MPLNHNDHFAVNATPTAAHPRRKVIEFKLSEEALEEILKGTQALTLDIGQSKLLIGTSAHDFTTHDLTQLDTPSSEVYSRYSTSHHLDLVGNITHRYHVKRNHVQNSQKKATTYEPLRSTVILGPDDLNKRIKSTAAAAKRRAPSPLPPTVPVTVPTAATSANAIPLKTRVIQLLALQPLTLSELHGKVRHGDLQSILQLVAIPSGGKYVLKAESYRGVKIYDWKYYSAKEREVVIKNATVAFDKLGLGPDASERTKLLPEKIKHSPPLVAEGNHALLDVSRQGRGTGGGGSESEGASLKPTPARKKAISKGSSLTGKKKATTTSTTTTHTKSSTKSGHMSAEKVAASILHMVPNNSTRPTLSTSTAALASSQSYISSSTSLTPAIATTTVSSLSSSSSSQHTTGLSAKRSPLIGSNTTLQLPSPGTAPTTRRRPSLNGIGTGNTNGHHGSNGYSGQGHLNGSADPTADATTKHRGAESTKKTTIATQHRKRDTENGAKNTKVGPQPTPVQKSPSPPFTVPLIRTQAEYEEVSRQFLGKYQEMKALKVMIDEKKVLFDHLGAQLEKAMGTEREQELKRKVREAFGEEDSLLSESVSGGGVDRKMMRLSGELRCGMDSGKRASSVEKLGSQMSIRAMAEQYTRLHTEVGLMKEALWNAGSGGGPKSGAKNGVPATAASATAPNASSMVKTKRGTDRGGMVSGGHGFMPSLSMGRVMVHGHGGGNG